MGQISQDGMYYDYYGKFGAAFEDSLLDGPVGSAKADYEEWLMRNPDILKDINKKIKNNYEFTCTDKQLVIPDIDNISKDDVNLLDRLTKQMLFSMENNEWQVVVWEDPDKKHDRDYRPKPDKPKRSPLQMLTDLIQGSIFNWKPGNSEKEDRSKLVQQLFGIFMSVQTGQMDPYHAGSAALWYTTQYLYKLRLHVKQAAFEKMSSLQSIISNTVNQRFILVNRDRMIHFKDKILKDCHQMAKILNNHNFTPLFEKKITDFYSEFENANMEMVTEVSNKYVELVINQQSQGGMFNQDSQFDAQTQRLYLERAMSECDANSAQIFQTLSKKYHEQVKAEMEQMMFSSLLVNLQGQPVSYANLQQLQNQANVKATTPAPLYLGNLRILNLAQNSQPAQTAASLQAALY